MKHCDGSGYDAARRCCTWWADLVVPRPQQLAQARLSASMRMRFLAARQGALRCYTLVDEEINDDRGA